jgi:hypothetical protein
MDIFADSPQKNQWFRLVEEMFLVLKYLERD